MASSCIRKLVAVLYSTALSWRASDILENIYLKMVYTLLDRREVSKLGCTSVDRFDETWDR